jgi:hypothetical protein
MSFDPLPGMCGALGKAAKRPSSHMMVERGKKKTNDIFIFPSTKCQKMMEYELCACVLRVKRKKK